MHLLRLIRQGEVTVGVRWVIKEHLQRKRKARDDGTKVNMIHFGMERRQAIKFWKERGRQGVLSACCHALNRACHAT